MPGRPSGAGVPVRRGALDGGRPGGGWRHYHAARLAVPALVLGERPLGNFTVSSSADALTAHGYLYLVLPLALGYSAT